MKYFIDFEMLFPDYRIGQIGCVNIKGEEFVVHVSYNYSEIAKIARNILRDTVMSPDDAFSALFDWIYKDETGKPEIYCWGDHDRKYAKVTTNYMVRGKGKMMALFLYHNLINYHSQFISKYGRTKNIKLEHAAKILDPTIKQGHIAIEDAKILRMVYLLSDIFPIYNKTEVLLDSRKKADNQITDSNQGNLIIAVSKDNLFKKTFLTVGKAADWLITHKSIIRNRPMIIGNIRNALKRGIRAYNFYWRMI